MGHRVEPQGEDHHHRSQHRDDSGSSGTLCGRCLSWLEGSHSGRHSCGHDGLAQCCHGWLASIPWSGHSVRCVGDGRRALGKSGLGGGSLALHACGHPWTAVGQRLELGLDDAAVIAGIPDRPTTGRTNACAFGAPNRCRCDSRRALGYGNLPIVHQERARAEIHP